MDWRSNAWTASGPAEVTGQLVEFLNMARTRTSSDAELLVELRRSDDVPLHRQLEQELRAAIRSGRLTAGSVVPSTRGLATQLGLSRGVVVEAYEQLVAEGYLTSQPGGTTRISERVADATPTPPTERPDKPPVRIDFGYGRPDLTQFPRAAWMRSIRRVLNEAPSDRLAYLDPRGADELREALADYLNRVRGTCAASERVVICNGFSQAVVLVAQALRMRGQTRIAVEDPGQEEDLRRVATMLGLATVPIPVDEDGIRVDALVRSDADLVVVTPAHQFPTGAVLSAERRAALVAWATDGNRRILEDDYDAEYRYDREPIGALQGLAPEHVVYAGSASKTLAPGLRLGWMVAPGDLVDDLAAIKQSVDRGSPSLEQLAFADFLARGEFDHHLRRMRPIYRARRDALLKAIGRHLPGFDPCGAEAGLHVVALLPPGVAEAPLVDHAAQQGVAVTGLAHYHHDPAGAGQGLLFGYGRVTEAQIEEGIRVVASALA